ncbi:MAG: hypothetical protein ACJAVK_002894 [Akkermansiaceae bacterium]|jgi:hypothetical protein
MRFLPSLLAFAMALPAVGQNPLQRDEDPIPAAVDNIYTKGLRFLAKTQKEDGSWADSVGTEPGVVGLAVMAFLAHGEDPNHGEYASNIKQGIAFILKQQDEGNGYIGSSMYSHGFATLALSECYGMYRDPRIAPALKKAVELILSSQKRNPRGGWRYSPDATTSDSSIAGCQIVALYAARNAGIPVPDAALEKGMKFMRKCRGSDGGYGYQSAMGDRPTLTAIGVLCESLAKQQKTKLYGASTKYLAKYLNHRESHYAYYFEYYMAQALFHSDEEVWQQWNAKNTRYLGVLQGPNGSFPGSRGESFNTAGALLSLALNYRFLPIYEK